MCIHMNRPTLYTQSAPVTHGETDTTHCLNAASLSGTHQSNKSKGFFANLKVHSFACQVLE